MLKRHSIAKQEIMSVHCKIDKNEKIIKYPEAILITMAHKIYQTHQTIQIINHLTLRTLFSRNSSDIPRLWWIRKSTQISLRIQNDYRWTWGLFWAKTILWKRMLGIVILASEKEIYQFTLIQIFYLLSKYKPWGWYQ